MQQCLTLVAACLLYSSAELFIFMLVLGLWHRHELVTRFGFRIYVELLIASVLVCG